ncbi:MAG: hypothetical protein PHN89_00545 [Candidatus Pacebacteria bacterium]|nr:hypothetical protein [Candidatus Paceibacterota bacterium]
MAGGRPSKMTPEVVKKLEEAFSIGASVSEACFYADISRETYYQWIKNNPELADRFEALKNKPILKARQTVVKALETDPDIALKYLERKRKDEFSPRQEIGGIDGKPLPSIQVEIIRPEQNGTEEKNKSDNSIREDAGKPKENNGK